MSLRIRTVVALLPALLLTTALGASTLLESAGCAPCCSDEGSADEDCPPDCNLCACCPSLRGVLASRIQMPIAADVNRSPAAEIDFELPAPDPREILHVPRALL